MVRAGKFKTKRGGGRQFSRNIETADNEDAFDKWQAKGSDDDDDEDSSEEGTSEGTSESGSGSDSGSESDEEVPLQKAQPTGITMDPKKAAAFGNTLPDTNELSRADRKAAKKNQKKKKVAKGESEDEEESEDDDADLRGMRNMNLDKKGKGVVPGSKDQGLNRKEKEAEEKKAAAERYQALHAAGKTDQAKTDMARLAKIRKDREEAAAKRLAEAKAVKDAADAKVAAQKARRG